MPEVFAKGLLVSGSAGRSASALTQHVFFALSLTFDGYGLHNQQLTRTPVYRLLARNLDRYANASRSPAETRPDQGLCALGRCAGSATIRHGEPSSAGFRPRCSPGRAVVRGRESGVHAGDPDVLQAGDAAGVDPHSTSALCPAQAATSVAGTPE